MEENIKESINKYLELIKNLSSLSNIQLIAFVNILSINPEMFNTLKKVTDWESIVLLKFMKEEEQSKEKKKRRPTKEATRASEDMFEQSQYSRVQIGGEKK